MAYQLNGDTDISDSEMDEYVDKSCIQNAVRNSSLELAALEQQRADENVTKLAKDRKQKEELQNRIFQLEKQLDAKKALELEIERLKGTLNVVKHMEADGDMEVLEKVDTIIKSLREKEDELKGLEALNQILIVKERKSNDKLQEARKELINGLKDMPSSAHIGVKRMGELNTQPFFEAMKRKYNEEEAEERATELCSLWEEYLKDLDWHPFRIAMEIIDDEDEKLRGLKDEFGAKSLRSRDIIFDRDKRIQPKQKVHNLGTVELRRREKSILEGGSFPSSGSLESKTPEGTLKQVPATCSGKKQTP